MIFKYRAMSHNESYLNAPGLLVSVSLEASLRNVPLFHRRQSGKLAFCAVRHLR